MKSCFYYWGPLLFKTKINKEDLFKINQLCKKDKSKDARKFLAGHLDHEYYIEKEKLFEILVKYFDVYKDFYYEWYRGKLFSIEINSSWVNYMKKGDYNPPHIHLECDLSSVLYLKVPSELKKENDNYSGSIKDGGPGSISFYYGEYRPLSIDQVRFFPEEGDFFVFPAFLKHAVAPFKSDVERVSVAANFNIK